MIQLVQKLMLLPKTTAKQAYKKEVLEVKQ
jgi:hypothetical protein